MKIGQDDFDKAVDLNRRLMCTRGYIRHVEDSRADYLKREDKSKLIRLRIEHKGSEIHCDVRLDSKMFKLFMHQAFTDGKNHLTELESKISEIGIEIIN